MLEKQPATGRQVRRRTGNDGTYAVQPVTAISQGALWLEGQAITGEMRVAGSEAELADASVQSVPMPYTVPAPSGAMVCAQVAVSRGQGATGPYSAAKCLTVP